MRVESKGLTLANQSMLEVVVATAPAAAVGSRDTSGTLEESVVLASSVVADASAVH